MTVDLSFDALEPKYKHLWETSTILPSRKSAADLTASRILANKSRYLTVEQATTVPFFVVGLIHAMEGGLNFNTHLHNGDSLARRTVHVPRGRPKEGNPPFTWEESAIDALTLEGLDKITDWTPERVCFALEGYNGWGYARYHPEVNTPYLWSGTSAYVRGKYVEDGQWSSTAVSGQSGAVAILKCAMDRDQSIAVALEGTPAPTVADAVPAADGPATAPAAPTPATIADLIPVSRKMAMLDKIRQWFAGLGLGTTGITADSLMQPDGIVNKNVTPVISAHPMGALLAFAVVCVAIVVGAVIIMRYIAEDYNTGSYLPSKGAADV